MNDLYLDKDKPCDCLNDCGDDPRLIKGIVNYCGWSLHIKYLKAEREAHKQNIIYDLQLLSNKIKLKSNKQTILNTINHLKEN